MSPRLASGSPHVAVHMADTEAVINEMRAGVPYPFRDLYARYVEHVQRAGRQPEHPTTFGMALGQDPRVVASRTKHHRMWRLAP